MDTTFLQQSVLRFAGAHGAVEHRLFLRRRWRVDGRSVRVRPQARHHRRVVLGPGHRYGGGIIHGMLLQTHGVYFTSHPDLIPHLHRHLRVRVLLPRGCSAISMPRCSSPTRCRWDCSRWPKRQLAFSLEQGFVLSVILGTITAVAVARCATSAWGDARHFQQSDFYAVADLGGSFAFVALAYAGSPLPLAGVACVFVVVFLRYWAVLLRLEDQQARDLTSPSCGAQRGQGAARRVRCVPAGGDATDWRRRASPPRPSAPNHEKRD